MRTDHGRETATSSAEETRTGQKGRADYSCAGLSSTADIYETEDALRVILEMPGVEKSNINVRVEDGFLHVDGRLDLTKYQGLQPLYIEYNVGHYSRRFQLSSKIDQTKIGAALNDGVLSLTLPKVEEAKPRVITISQGRDQ